MRRVVHALSKLYPNRQEAGGPRIIWLPLVVMFVEVLKVSVQPQTRRGCPSSASSLKLAPSMACQRDRSTIGCRYQERAISTSSSSEKSIPEFNLHF